MVAPDFSKAGFGKPAAGGKGPASGALVTLGDGRLAMSTLEIAKLTGKSHDNVLRDARKMLEELGFGDGLSFEGIYLDAYKREKPCFNLPKDLTYTLVSGYSVQMRHRIVTRWMELEAEKAVAAPAPAAFRIPRSLPDGDELQLRAATRTTATCCARSSA